MGHVRPFTLGPGGIKPISSNILRSARGNMLRHFEEETHQGEGFGFALEELVVRGVGDHSDLAVLLDAQFLTWR